LNHLVLLTRVRLLHFWRGLGIAFPARAPTKYDLLTDNMTQREFNTC
jgi:hypothetical protein